ncbi:thiolase family protein [Rhodococcus sp. NPDC059968]|uniref:thiolase family protein n=1 Tax=Rhodococcus sp. NPDC059968 TaxID=3347017 RepID=UPI00366C9E8E
MSSFQNVYLCAPVRTPHGRYGGALSESSAVDLGVLVAREALTRAHLAPGLVDEAVVSHCRQAGNGPNPARQVTLLAGLPEAVPAQTINMACGSGLKAIELAALSVEAGGTDVALVVGTEHMSSMPYLASSSLRWQGQRRGDIVLVDSWKDSATDPVCGLSMLETAERVAAEFAISRQEQDAWALTSHRRAKTAWESGVFDAEVCPVTMPHGVVRRDETIRFDASGDSLASIRPATGAGGTVTAGNASQMADGAAALIIASAAAVEQYGLEPMGRLLSFAAVGVDPALMGIGPTVAIPRAMKEAGACLDDIELLEINEAFASQVVQNLRALELDGDRVNINGGGIALGHPTGQSGCRLTGTLLHSLRRRGGGLGVASLCVGGGQGVAAVVESIAS